METLASKTRFMADVMLSKYELNCALLYLEGYSNQAIADQLNLSKWTVSYMLKNAQAKMKQSISGAV